MNQHVGLVEIECRKCGTLNPLSEAISRQIAERVRAESKAETLRQQQALVAREKEVAEKERALDQKVEERVRTEQARIVTVLARAC